MSEKNVFVDKSKKTNKQKNENKLEYNLINLVKLLLFHLFDSFVCAYRLGLDIIVHKKEDIFQQTRCCRCLWCIREGSNLCRVWEGSGRRWPGCGGRCGRWPPAGHGSAGSSSCHQHEGTWRPPAGRQRQALELPVRFNWKHEELMKREVEH